MPDVARGTLFLGGRIDPASGDRTGDAILYEAHHLTTHGVIVGMTGSGKTGLGVVALEEALLSGIPALVIDPKGDMGNLLLNFPAFRAEDFLPWVDPAEAKRKSLSSEEFAAQTADTWRSGLESWDLGAERMRALGTGAAYAIYTPGSAAGIPLNIVGSLEVPDLDWDTDAESLRDEIEGFVSSLLVLAGIDADPISSPEHILLATIIERSWREGRSLDLERLITQVQDPPVRKLGVFELDAFFPPKERTELAMRLNGLVASPSFASWLQGPPLDVGSLLTTPEGKPRASVIYLPHLSEQERQFIVTLLLSKVVTWMRAQPGTSDLRALIYMDEVFGFAPPTAEPPSKKPILTILKQARAHGVGMLLSTQNPVDLDYKAMSNAGTWMIGRLQTERDKARILEGLESASGAIDVDLFDELIGGLDKRQFVLHSTRAKEPQVFTTRWAMSYLRGPLTKEEVSRLTADAPERAGAAPAPVAEPAGLADDESPVPPTVADGVPVYYLDPAASWAGELGAVPGGTRLEAAVAARVHLTFDDTKAGLDHDEVWEAVVHPLETAFDPEAARAVEYDDRDLRPGPPASAVYVLPEAPIDESAYFKGAAQSLKDHLHRTQHVQVLRNTRLELYSRVGESREEFLRRCEEAAEDAADAEVAKLKERYEAKIKAVQKRLAAAERRVRELETDVAQRRQQEVVAGAGELLSVFLGGRRRSRSLSGAASRRSTTVRTQQRLRSAEDKLADETADLEALEDDLAADLQEITAKWEEVAADVEELEIGLEKTDIAVDEVALCWVPVE